MAVRLRWVNAKKNRCVRIPITLEPHVYPIDKMIVEHLEEVGFEKHQQIYDEAIELHFALIDLTEGRVPKVVPPELQELLRRVGTDAATAAKEMGRNRARAPGVRVDRLRSRQRTKDPSKV